MYWKKSCIAQTAFLPVLFLTLCILPQGEFPFLRSSFACCGELYPLFRGAFSFFLFFTGWKLSSLGKWIPGSDGVFFCLFLFCGMFLLPGMLLNCFSAGGVCMYLGIWGGYILGLQENCTGKLATGYFFWILPLPFLLYLIPFQIKTEYLVYAVFLPGGFFFIIHSLLLIGFPERKNQFLLLFLSFTLFFIPGIYGFMESAKKMPYSRPSDSVKQEKSSVSLFPLLSLALLHRDHPQQKILILSEEPFRVTEYLPEAADSSPALLFRTVSLSGAADFFQEDDHTLYNVIVLQLQKPQNLQVARFYSLPFYKQLKQRLQRGGILAIRLPDPETGHSSETGKWIRKKLSCLLPYLFTDVKILPGGRQILCSTDQKPLLTDPELLEYRAAKIFSGKINFPPGFFHILLDQGQSAPETASEEKSSVYPYSNFSQISLCITENAKGFSAGFWQKLLHTNSKIRKYLPLCTLLLLIGYVLYRYFRATGKRQGDFLVFENGFYAGTLMGLCCVILPVKWADKFPVFYDAGLLLFPLIGFYCGLILRNIFKGKFMVYSSFVLSGFPLFLFRTSFTDPFINEILLLAGGTACAYFAGSLHSFRKTFFPGIGTGLLLACFSLILPGLDLILPWVTLLCFIPAIQASENMENGFEKSQKNATVQKERKERIL